MIIPRWFSFFSYFVLSRDAVVQINVVCAKVNIFAAALAHTSISEGWKLHVDLYHVFKDYNHLIKQSVKTNVFSILPMEIIDHCLYSMIWKETSAWPITCPPPILPYSYINDLINCHFPSHPSSLCRRLQCLSCLLQSWKSCPSTPLIKSPHGLLPVNSASLTKKPF